MEEIRTRPVKPMQHRTAPARTRGGADGEEEYAFGRSMLFSPRVRWAGRRRAPL
jgi:hypothetical protein